MSWLIPAWIIIAPALVVAFSGIIGGTKTVFGTGTYSYGPTSDTTERSMRPPATATATDRIV